MKDILNNGWKILLVLLFIVIAYLAGFIHGFNEGQADVIDGSMEILKHLDTQIHLEFNETAFAEVMTDKIMEIQEEQMIR